VTSIHGASWILGEGFSARRTIRVKRNMHSIRAICVATAFIAGDVVVNAASGSSGSSARDSRMTRQILEAQRYPEIHFMPTGFTGSISLANISTKRLP
jgi:hypothetical protein